MIEYINAVDLMLGVAIGGGASLAGFYAGSRILNKAQGVPEATLKRKPSELPKWREQRGVPKLRECLMNIEPEEERMVRDCVFPDDHQQAELRRHGLGELADEVKTEHPFGEPAENRLDKYDTPDTIVATVTEKPKPVRPHCVTCNRMAKWTPAPDGKHYCGTHWPVE